MCSPDVPDTSAAQEKAIESQERISNRQLDLQDRMLDYFTQRQDRIDPLQEEVQRRQLANAEETANQGRDIFEYQKQVFRPVEESLVAQAMQESTPQFYEKYAQQAVAQIAGAQQNERDQFSRAAASMGINPNSGAYAAGQRGLQLQEAAQLGAGMNEARDRAEALSFARRADVAGLGKGLVGAGNASYGLALQGNSSALEGANETTRTAAVTMGTPTQYGQMGIQAGMNAGTLANDIYRSQAQAAAGGGGSELLGAAGTALGYWASTGFAT